MENPTIQKNFLSRLLPYELSSKTNGSLKSGLKEYSLLLEATRCAILALKNGNLEEFDAVVGENACQIRAVKIAMLFPKYMQTIQSLQNRVELAQQKIVQLTKTLDPLMKSGISLEKLLQEPGLDIDMTSDELFLIESYLLFIAKTVKPSKASAPLCRNDAADPKRLKQFEKDVSASFTDNLVKKAASAFV